jgi:alpha/beta hydrolase family protein
MVQPGARSRIVLAIIWLLLGAAMVAVSAWLGWTRWSAILSGHPALLAMTIVCALVGIVAVLWAVGSLVLGSRQDREGDAWHPARRTPTELRRRARWRIILAVPALVVCVALVGVVAYARPFVATPVAVAALSPDDRVRVADRITWYEMSPIREDRAGNEIRPTTGLVLVPGARVDPRAYAHVLRPLVEAGYFVAVLKEPLGLSVLDADHAETLLAVHPEITYWALAGHSLGGVTAASLADANEQVHGLVLFGSYPASPIVRTDLKVASIYGSEDGLTTPADVDASRTDLPPETTYVEVPGAAHSWFGDYGDQPGDKTGSGDRAAAQAKINEATRALLVSLAPPPKKK